MSGNETIDLEDEDIPDRETCQRLCENFATITGTDTACAQFYLQDRQWNLDRSVNAYFDARNNDDDDVQILNDGSEPNVVITAAAFAAAIGAATSSVLPPKDFKFVSWNVDGLDDRSLKNRTKAVCNIISCELPDVVILQEVIPESFSYMESHLPAYKVIAGGDENYFAATLLRKNTVDLENSRIISFPNTAMGRNMLVTKIKLGGDIPMCIINTHLESTAEHSSTRISQLKQVFKQVLAEENAKTVIAGGDLNLRDKELSQIGGTPPGVDDMWQVCGQRPECQYTWDARRNENIQLQSAFRPRCRFDRVYVRHSHPQQVVPFHFGLVGIEKLRSCGRYPSDHWGLVVRFHIDRAETDKENKSK